MCQPQIILSLLASKSFLLLLTKLIVGSRPAIPTIEEMVIDFATKISSKLPDYVSIYSLKLEETETSYSEWFASDN